MASVRDTPTMKKYHTLGLLGGIAGDCAYDSVFLAGEAVFSAFCIALRTSSVILGFARSVLLLARALP